MSISEYPLYHKKISVKLSKQYNQTVFWFKGGDLSKWKNVVKNDDIISSSNKIYSFIKNKKKINFFKWCIIYYIKSSKKIENNKIKKKYKSLNDQSSHILEPICTDWHDNTKLNVSSDLFESKDTDFNNPYGSLIELLIKIANMQIGLKKIHFKTGWLYHGWLSNISNQGLFIRKKLKHWAWTTFPLEIKKPKNFSLIKMISDVIHEIPKSRTKELKAIASKRISFLKSKIHGQDFESLIYLRNEINSKIKFSFENLDNEEKKLLKKFRII